MQVGWKVKLPSAISGQFESTEDIKIVYSDCITICSYDLFGIHVKLEPLTEMIGRAEEILHV